MAGQICASPNARPCEAQSFETAATLSVRVDVRDRLSRSITASLPNDFDGPDAVNLELDDLHDGSRIIGTWRRAAPRGSPSTKADNVAFLTLLLSGQEGYGTILLREAAWQTHSHECQSVVGGRVAHVLSFTVEGGQAQPRYFVSAYLDVAEHVWLRGIAECGGDPAALPAIRGTFLSIRVTESVV